MKVFNLVAGILCIALSLLITLQSCAVGFGNAMFSTGEVSGSAGLIVAIMLLAGGIVMIATRKSESAGGEIANTIMFSLGTLIGTTSGGSFTDLRIWSGLCLILAVVNLISLYTK